MPAQRHSPLRARPTNNYGRVGEYLNDPDRSWTAVAAARPSPRQRRNRVENSIAHAEATGVDLYQNPGTRYCKIILCPYVGCYHNSVKLDFEGFSKNGNLKSHLLRMHKDDLHSRGMEEGVRKHQGKGFGDFVWQLLSPDLPHDIATGGACSGDNIPYRYLPEPPAPPGHTNDPSLNLAYTPPNIHPLIPQPNINSQPYPRNTFGATTDVTGNYVDNVGATVTSEPLEDGFRGLRVSSTIQLGSYTRTDSFNDWSYC